MKITIIHGQNHKGSTHAITRELAEKIGGEITEFFLPRDFAQPCLGCYTCFQKDLTHCPHFAKLQPLLDALLAADIILPDSPVYVYHATGQIMAFWTISAPGGRCTARAPKCAASRRLPSARRRAAA